MLYHEEQFRGITRIRRGRRKTATARTSSAAVRLTLARNDFEPLNLAGRRGCSPSGSRNPLSIVSALGLSTGPKTPEGKARVAEAARRTLAKRRAEKAAEKESTT